VAGALSDRKPRSGADLLRQALTQPRFDEDAVARVRGQVQAVIRAEATDPNAIAPRRWRAQAWGDHPYGSSINGTAESVAALTRDDLIDARTASGPRPGGGGRAGDITPEQLGAADRQDAGRCCPKPAPRRCRNRRSF
jgi:zinc protease